MSKIVFTQAAVDIFTDEPSLEKRMWKFCAMRVGLALLQNHFAFRVSMAKNNEY